MHSGAESPVEGAETSKNRAHGPRRFKRLVLYVLAACILYVATYLVMSRVTSVTEEVRTREGLKVCFLFFGQERELKSIVFNFSTKEYIETNDGRRTIFTSSGWVVPEVVCYYFFWPMARLDAFFGMRYHAMRTHTFDDGSSEVW